MEPERIVIVNKTGCGTWILAAIILALLLVFLGPCLPACGAILLL